MISAILVIGIGIPVLIFSYRKFVRLQHIGLDILSKPERKKFKKSYYAGSVLDEPPREDVVIHYTAEQQKLISKYWYIGVMLTIGGIILLIGSNMLLPVDKTGLPRYWSASSFIYASLPIIQIVRVIYRIKNYARQLNSDNLHNPPDDDDDRWWTGIW